jgi:hypothetical protein
MTGALTTEETSYTRQAAENGNDGKAS